MSTDPKIQKYFSKECKKKSSKLSILSFNQKFLQHNRKFKEIASLSPLHKNLNFKMHFERQKWKYQELKIILFRILLS